MKQTELGDGVEKMETGLEKLAEASASVQILKKDLAVMEQDLAEASKRVITSNHLYYEYQRIFKFKCSFVSARPKVYWLK